MKISLSNLKPVITGMFVDWNYPTYLVIIQFYNIEGRLKYNIDLSNYHMHWINYWLYIHENRTHSQNLDAIDIVRPLL